MSDNNDEFKQLHDKIDKWIKDNFSGVSNAGNIAFIGIPKNVCESLYDDVSDKYFSDIEVACNWYWESKPEDVPEFIYGTKPLEIDDSLIERLSERVLSYIDTDGDELSGEGDNGYFSECLKPAAIDELENLLKIWLQKHSNTVVPDYDHKESLREEYIKWMKGPN